MTNKLEGRISKMEAYIETLQQRTNSMQKTHIEHSKTLQILPLQLEQIINKLEAQEQKFDNLIAENKEMQEDWLFVKNLRSSFIFGKKALWRSIIAVIIPALLVLVWQGIDRR